MNLPQKVNDNIWELYLRNKNLAEGSDNERRALTRMIAEQNAWDLGISWGTKSSSPSNPPSKDAIAFNKGTSMDVWDWQNGATREPQTFPDKEPDFPDIVGQNFIEVTPTNHLGTIDPPIPPPVHDCCDELKAQNDAIIAIVSSQSARLSNLESLCARIDMNVVTLLETPADDCPDYEGRILFQNVVMRPVK